MIYVMAEIDVHDGPVKIGWLRHARTDGDWRPHVLRRISELQTGNHRKLEVVAVADGDQDDEIKMHAAFEEHHVSGEWFERGPRVVRFISLHRVEPVRGARVEQYRAPLPERLPAGPPSLKRSAWRAVPACASCRGCPMPAASAPYQRHCPWSL